MRLTHGTYPFHDGWEGVWSYFLQAIPKNVVESFLMEVPPMLDDEGELPNKGFRVVRAVIGINDATTRVLAVYNQDGEFHLIVANERRFNEVDWSLRGGHRNYKVPLERLPFPMF